ncbi:MAG: SAM-dependent methyltransferase [Candidatus Magnetoovum sp. WYHC-5]|nr:SAM-dependent methyltransferase [Candidatus Magnetoovum sp. WYHC-5]
MLKTKIVEKIKHQGPLSFHNYMDMALYYPDYGYYTSKETEIGKEGDFFTSAHLHPIFGQLIGQQIEQMWQLMGKPIEFFIVEFGAGKGYLFYDLINTQTNDKFIKALKYVIIEKNPHMIAKQAKLLTPYIEKIQWLSSIKELGSFSGCVLANELIDAFPIHLIERKNNSTNEIYLDYQTDKFVEILKLINNNYLKEFNIELPPNNYKTEINLALKDWLSDLATYLIDGFIFIIDYGYPAWEYYSPERNRGTLLCYYKHKINENPYINIGKQDITTHVNFTAIHKWAQSLNFQTLGYCTQGNFLISMEIDKILMITTTYMEDLPKIKRLILPQGMGESHKVIISYKGNAHPELRGFSFKNHISKLQK